MNLISNKILKNYILGKCSNKEIGILHNWINASPENATWLFKMVDAYHTKHLLHNIDEVRLQQAEVDIIQRILQEEANIKRSRMLRLVKYAAACIAMVLVSAVTIMLWRGQTRMIEVTTQANEMQHLILPDSTEVWINSNSTLKYPQQFAQNSRKIELQGEAYFEVKKDTTRPFMVQNDALSVKVLGTHFNFSAYQQNQKAEVALLEGCVQVIGNHQEGMITIKPNQKAILDKQTSSIEVTHIYAPLEAAWHNNIIPFENMTIVEIINVLEKYYEVEIEIGSQLYNKSTYSGEICCKSDIDSVLKALAYSIPFKYKREGNKIRMY